MMFPWVWRLFGQLEIICAGHTPKMSIFGNLRVKVDHLSHSEGYGRVSDLSKGQDHIPYMESHVLLRFKIGHLTTLAPDTVSFIVISTLHEATTNLYQPYSDLLYFKINKNVKEKSAGNQEKTVSSVGTGKEILLNC